MIRFWFVLCAMSPLGICLFAQDTLRVNVRPLSTLEIHGETNINNFTCEQTYQSPDFTQVELIQDGSEILFNQASLAIPVKEFDCGHKIMTRDFQEILEADRIPDLVIRLNSVTSEHDVHVADVTIRIAGKARKYKIPLRVIKHQEGMTGIGQRQVRFGEFGLEPPVKFMGMVKVKEELNISFTIRIDQIQ